MAARAKVNCRESREDQWAFPDCESENVGAGAMTPVHKIEMRPLAVTRAPGAGAHSSGVIVWDWQMGIVGGIIQPHRSALDMASRSSRYFQ